MKFNDYHRTVIGYHATRLSVAKRIINRKEDFEPSRNEGDWLGEGVYFWEYSPAHAMWWAERKLKADHWGEPIAILASVIRLGFCLDLLDRINVEYLIEAKSAYANELRQSGLPIPENAYSDKRLDCQIFEFAYRLVERSSNRPVDTSRAVYVPTGKAKRVWQRSWISKETHIQLCVRSPSCILGTWLHHRSDQDSLIDDHEQTSSGGEVSNAANPEHTDGN